MKHKNLTINYTESDTISELPEADQLLMQEAIKSAGKAYAPYSGFSVGAAVLLSSGKIITGNNQENAAYPSGLCAERVALFAASALYPDVKIDTIVVTIKTAHKITEPVSPCGACRQVIAEYENRQNQKIKIIFSGETGKSITVDGIENLLPIIFNSRKMNKE
ncbi:MAG: cytidine deaminase [Bacteroidetes bacterium HGW-Bacteroidetes-11]|jgi:cytidine deaminase|nr:MAG: cytidine deaminase [Bacteroidetes bacterium HGW-Bacteroidetes-11]